MKKQYKVGDRVRYTSNRHDLSSSNPLWDHPKYGQVVGTVTSLDGPVIKVRWDNGTNNNYRSHDLTPHKGGNMLEKVKIAADKTYAAVKPYEKYIGLIALAAVIDHFFLDNKFTDRFKKLAEALVTKITDGLDKLIEKLKVEPEDEPEAGKTAAEETVSEGGA